jgi:hypothetical protein
VALYWYEKALQNENGNLDKQEIKDAKQLMKLLKEKFAAYPLPK